MTVVAPDHPLDVRLACAALAWSLDSMTPGEDVAERLVRMAAGNRTAVARALRRVPARGRAADALRLTLSRGSWAW